MYSNFDFIFYPFLLIDIDYLIMYDLCSFSVPRGIALSSYTGLAS
jgi:hypothetical protein